MSECRCGKSNAGRNFAAVFCLGIVAFGGVFGGVLATALAESEERATALHSRVVLANMTPARQTFVFTSSQASREVSETELSVALQPNQIMVLRFSAADEGAPALSVERDASAGAGRIRRELPGFDLIWIPNASIPDAGNFNNPFASLTAGNIPEQPFAEDHFSSLPGSFPGGAGITGVSGFSASGVIDWPTRSRVVHAIPVAVYVDEEQTASRQLWVSRLQRRLEAANEVFRETCGIEFRIIEAGTWTSDDSLRDLQQGLDDFAAKVQPSEARLAIGYGSQFGGGPIGEHLGVSRGILARHILISDTGMKMGEADHLAILIHELGHYLGAVHVPSDQSVMFAKTQPDLVRDKHFQVGFDPLNALILNCTAEELLQGKRSTGEFSRETIHVLKAAYRAAAALPGTDATPNQALALVAPADAPPAVPAPEPDLSATNPARRENVEGAPATRTLSPAVEAARVIIGGIVADLASDLESRNGRGAGAPAPIPGITDSDARFEWLVRQAAGGALNLPEGLRPHAHAGFLIAVGVLTDPTDLLLDQPVVGVVWRGAESPAERARRIALLGRLTIQGREDWAQHFAVSMALVELAGAGPAKSLGLMKEWRDSHGQSGFSFADLAADYAGVRLADGLKRDLFSLRDLERDFKIADFVPRLAFFPEGITATQLQTEYGGLTGRPFAQMLDRIEATIAESPGWTRLRRNASE